MVATYELVLDGDAEPLQVARRLTEQPHGLRTHRSETNTHASTPENTTLKGA